MVVTFTTHPSQLRTAVGRETRWDSTRIGWTEDNFVLVSQQGTKESCVQESLLRLICGGIGTVW